MSNYELALTAGEIDIALQKAHNPDTSPQANDNLVTSGGVKTYVDGEVSTLNTSSFEESALDTTVGGLTNSDTAIPTSAAVKNYVDANKLGVITLRFNGSVSGWNTTNIPVSILSSNIAAVDNGTTISVPHGSYMYTVAGNLPTLSYRQELFLLNYLRLKVGSGWTDSRPISAINGFLPNVSSIYMRAQTYGGTVSVSNLDVFLLKLS